jgi:hypothetical protein
VAQDVFPRRFEVLSTDPKPPGIGAEDVCDELDTGRRFKWAPADGRWHHRGSVPTDGVLLAALGHLGQTLQAMHRTLESIRQGLIEAGNCQDVSPADRETEMVNTN